MEIKDIKERNQRKKDKTESERPNKQRQVFFFPVPTTILNPFQFQKDKVFILNNHYKLQYVGFKKIRSLKRKEKKEIT